MGKQPEQKNFKLKKKFRLCKNRNFQTVYNRGRSYANKMLVLYVLPNRTGNVRVGFAAGKRLGGAVVRNRVKRLLREAYRFNQERIKSAVDLVLVGRQAMLKADLQAAVKALLDLFNKAGLIEQS